MFVERTIITPHLSPGVLAPFSLINMLTTPRAKSAIDGFVYVVCKRVPTYKIALYHVHDSANFPPQFGLYVCVCANIIHQRDLRNVVVSGRSVSAAIIFDR